MAHHMNGNYRDQFAARLPEGMRDQIAASATANERSMNAEIVMAIRAFYANERTLRDWFAGQALSGIAGISGEGFSLSPQDCARWAYEYADAMLSAREGGDA